MAMRNQSVATREKTFYVYLHCKPDGTPFYVGKGQGNRYREFSKGRNPHHKRIVAKYGKAQIRVAVFPCASESEALEDEKLHIAQLRAEGYELANITDGGDGVCGLVFSDDARAKIRAARAKQIMPPCSDEKKEKIRAAQAGKKRGPNRAHSEFMTGRKLSPEHIEKIVIANLGAKRTDATRLNISKALTGRKLSDEARRNMSLAHKGRPPSDLQLRAYASPERSRKMSEAHRGKVMSDEAKEKMRATKAANKKPVSDETRRKLSEAAKRQWERACK